MNLLAFSFSQTRQNPAQILAFSFENQQLQSGLMLALSFEQVWQMRSELLHFSFGQQESLTEQGRTFRFSGSQTQEFGDFDVQVLIDGWPAPMCDFAQTMKISRAENESGICEFVLLPSRQRKNQQEIDLYQWYQREIVVDVVSNHQLVRLFRGWIDAVDYEMLGGRLALRASDRREQQINNLPKSFVEKIGYTSKSAHSDEFDSIKAELDARLSTIPYAFDFDVDGTPILTAWKPKTTPDYVLSPCVIYQRAPSLVLAQVGGVVNAVDVEVSLSYPRWLQRSVLMGYSHGLGVCDYVRYGKLASLQNVADAISQTGWKLGGFSAERLEKSGWYNCGGRQIGWIRDPRVINNDQGGDESNHAIDVDEVRTTPNFDVKSGQFELLRRWSQNITQKFKLRVLNAPSIARYGENKQNANYSVQAAAPENLKWETPDLHRPKLNFDYDETRMQHLPFLGNQPIVGLPENVRHHRSPFGDVFVDWADGNHDFNQTVEVAYHTAYTQILASHRNSLNCEVKFMPFVRLSHTHRIEHSHFSGNAKVSGFVHEFDFEKGLGKTELQHRFFQNQFDDGSGYTPFSPISRETPPAVRFDNAFTLGRIELPKGTKLDDTRHFGMIYEYGTVSQGVVLWSPKQFVVKTPEVEQASTDPRQIVYEHDFNVNVFDDKITVRI